MRTQIEAGRPLDAANVRMDWVLSHPGFSAWLKAALSDSRGRDPIELLNELEVLNSVIRERCAAELPWISRMSKLSGDAE